MKRKNMLSSLLSMVILCSFRFINTILLKKIDLKYKLSKQKSYSRIFSKEYKLGSMFHSDPTVRKSFSYSSFSETGLDSYSIYNFNVPHQYSKF